MPKHNSKIVIRTSVAEHPACRAWSQLDIGNMPQEVIVLKKEHKKLVCRLPGIAFAGGNIIAKRFLRKNVEYELKIYEIILPKLPLRSLQFYGIVEDTEDDYCWLFLEDAGEEEYSPDMGEHRAIAGRWLGLMHTSAALVDEAACLPNIGPKRYLTYLQSARDTILQKLANHRLTTDDVVVLENILSQCDVIESHQNQLKRFCNKMPHTLVHGDFIPKNIRVQTYSDDIILLPFDWETAGWCIPAVDLSATEIDILAYWSVVQHRWPEIDMQILNQLVSIGKIFYTLASIYWDSPYLEYERIMKNMRSYQSTLTNEILATKELWS